ncbi:hypothetical protein SAMN05660330_01708 [Desulforhopalus singaporensis]|uniref:Uncharacterized protein n=1 Tax=Desulforhopalus singaporensis TaxID=91360 RepID=A0A1H0PLA5_9BACT|nr:hypothetical protein SAMN05660330_01708 [Desulforhopalus singaporensis]
MIDNSFSAYTGKIIKFYNLPVLGFGIIASSFFMVFWTLSLSLVFGANSNPYTDLLSEFFLHVFTSVYLQYIQSITKRQ